MAANDDGNEAPASVPSVFSPAPTVTVADDPTVFQVTMPNGTREVWIFTSRAANLSNADAARIGEALTPLAMQEPGQKLSPALVVRHARETPGFVRDMLTALAGRNATDEDKLRAAVKLLSSIGRSRATMKDLPSLVKA